MLVNGKNHHTIWVHPDNKEIIQVIDQRKIPFDFEVVDLKTPEDTFEAIKNMTVRGAPLIGITVLMEFTWVWSMTHLTIGKPNLSIPPII